MTRTEFVRAYAKQSGLIDGGTAVGLIDPFKPGVMIALPCACGSETCKGWGMFTPETVLHHLQFEAPQKLRDAYNEAVETEERKS